MLNPGRLCAPIHVLQVKSLILVINFDCPNHYEDYVHRVGRTGRAGADGTAWTFITPEQGQYAGDVIKAFEAQGIKKPPPSVEALWQKYKDARKLKGKTLMLKGSSGFGGRGFKFNAEENESKAKGRAKQAKKMDMTIDDGAEISDDEDIFNKDKDINTDIDAKIDELMGKNKTYGEAGDPMAMSTMPGAVAGPGAVSNPNPVLPSTLMGVPALKITAAEPAPSAMEQVHNAATSAVDRIMQGQSLDGGSKAQQAAARAMLMAKRMGLKVAMPAPKAVEIQEEVGQFSAEVEINDFPAEARFKVTRKEYLKEIQARSDCAITCRGNFVAPRQKAKDGEKKLYLVIESTTQSNVDRAKEEITRILKEELHREATTYTGRRGPGSKYPHWKPPGRLIGVVGEAEHPP